MDPATIIGVGLALAGIFGSMLMEGGDPMALFLIPPMMLVIFGTVGAAMAGGLLSDAKAMPKTLIKAMTAKITTPDVVVATIIKMAERARRDGLLALEGDVAAVEDPFLRRALEMAVDGTDADEVADILGSEVDAKRAANAREAKIFADMGGFSPTIGIIGTVIGLVHVLGSLSDPASLGAKIASAFVATLWGVMLANIFFFPVSNRLKRLSDVECGQMELAVEGVLAIQSGSNPRLIAAKLTSMSPPAEPAKKVA